jgi:fatty acid desaturase
MIIRVLKNSRSIGGKAFRNDTTKNSTLIVPPFVMVHKVDRHQLLCGGFTLTQFSQSIRKQISKIAKADDGTNYIYLILDYIAIIFSIWITTSYPSPLLYLVAVLVIGSRMRAFENLTHESSHGNLFINPLINQWVATIFCSLPIFTSYQTYLKTHVHDHHLYLGDVDKDPDRVRAREIGTDKFPIPRWKLILHVMKVLTFVSIPKYLWGSIKSFVYSPNINRDEQIARSIFWVTILAILQVFGLWWYFLLFWILPFLTSFQIIRYLAEMSEHLGLYGAESEIELTRNNFCNPLLRWFLYPHGDYFHLVHHLFCCIPHYNLGIAHRILLDDEDYRNKGHHCYGYLLPTNPDRPSTLEELMLEANPQLTIPSDPSA